MIAFIKVKEYCLFAKRTSVETIKTGETTCFCFGRIFLTTFVKNSLKFALLA
jgi:hypothetical protein